MIGVLMPSVVVTSVTINLHLEYNVILVPTENADAAQAIPPSIAIVMTNISNIDPCIP